jgi:hypothetical protein
VVVLHLPFHPGVCAPKWDLLVNAVQIDEENLLDLGLGKSIYSKKQVKEYLKFQDSQGTRQAFLTETVELACGGSGEDSSWGLEMDDQTRAILMDAVGWSLLPLLPSSWTLCSDYSFRTPCLEPSESFCDSDCRCLHHLSCQGHRAVVAGAFWSLPFQLIITPARWGREATTDVVNEMK